MKLNRKFKQSTKLIIAFALCFTALSAAAQFPVSRNLSKEQYDQEKLKLPWPPSLPNGKMVATDVSNEFLTKPERVKLAEGTLIAKTAPKVDFMYFQGQTEYSKLWSVWGDGSTEGTKFFTSIGDHKIPRGKVQIYEYDSKTKKLRQLMDVKKFLEESGTMPPTMDYTPAKIHGRTDVGPGGWVYFSTHRGSLVDNTTDARGFKGDWIMRVNYKTGKQEIVSAFPMPKHGMPASVLDPKRMIFYAGSAFGNDATEKGVWFLAYDINKKKLIKKELGGFERYAILANNGNVYWKGRVSGSTANDKIGQEEDPSDPNFGGRKYDPKTNEITSCPTAPGVKSCTKESKAGITYGFSNGNSNLWAFNSKTETLTDMGPAMVGIQNNVTSVDLDPVTERYVYYISGAHGGGVADGTPIVQFDVKTKTKKVIAFLSDYYIKKYNYALDGTYGTALSPDGSVLYVTWNGKRIVDSRDWDTCALTAIYIPKSERMP